MYKETQEVGEGKNEVLAKTAMNIIEDIERNTRWGIRRWDNKKDHKESLRADKRGEVLGVDYVQYEDKEAIDLFGMPQTTEIQGNILLQEGIENLWKLGATSGGVQWANANAYLGVGTSSTAEAATQTGLQSGQVYVAMDASYPLINGTGNVTCNWKSTFGSAVANQAWNEFSVSTTNLDTGKNLNRKVSAQGTKVSGQTWELTLAITLS